MTILIGWNSKNRPQSMAEQGRLAIRLDEIEPRDDMIGRHRPRTQLSKKSRLTHPRHRADIGQAGRSRP
ncbi:hypothetical protein ASD39_08120 [Sphingomonas sp. Root50]|nr:hypothetical protein ASD17_05010 [Sphingomonas sp. Root1294]KQY67865.1 hypothetical protein ASD39_08120 [Sphingomonas sp. Root50]KRB88789.1 hypothetical protein ASE22_20465 [Sphingomonas sp. Root720]